MIHNCNTSLKYFPLQNPPNNPAIAVVLNEKIFQICITLIFQNTNLYLSSALSYCAIKLLSSITSSTQSRTRGEMQNKYPIRGWPLAENTINSRASFFDQRHVRINHFFYIVPERKQTIFTKWIIIDEIFYFFLWGDA